MNITVYCGAAAGNDPAFAEAARELGAWMAGHGHDLVYGAGSTGLMGTVARAVLDGGGQAVGVIPEFLVHVEPPVADLTELHVVHTMFERKNLMIDFGDAFVALPGGSGTLEEISEIFSRLKLGYLSAPCILLNVHGFYDPLAAMLDRMVAEGLFPQGARDLVSFPATVEEAAALIEKAAR